MIWIILYILIAASVALLAYGNIIADDDYGRGPSEDSTIFAISIAFFIGAAWPVTLIAVGITYVVLFLQNKWGNNA